MKALTRTLALLGCAAALGAALAACDQELRDSENRANGGLGSNSVTLTFGDYDENYPIRSEAVTVNSGEAKKIEFTVNSVGTSNWSTPAYIISDADDGFLYIFRTDNWCNGPVPEKYDGETDPAGAYNAVLEKNCDWDFPSLLTYLLGAKAVATIENKGSTADLRIVFTKGSETHTQSYVNLPLQSNGTIKLFISGENSSVTITGTGTATSTSGGGNNGGGDAEGGDTPPAVAPTERFGVFLDLDSTDGAESYNMTVDSIVKDGTSVGSNINIKTDVYITDYTISDITVTGEVPYEWGIYNFGFTDRQTGKNYAVRCDGWNNNLEALTSTGMWPTDKTFEGASKENCLTKAPYECDKLVLLLTISEVNATPTVSTVRGTEKAELSKAVWTF